MTSSDSEPIIPASSGGAYACPICSGLITSTCRCGRVWSEWLYAEEVIVVALPRRDELTSAALLKAEPSE
jgi:hypothetical protein